MFSWFARAPINDDFEFIDEITVPKPVETIVKTVEEAEVETEVETVVETKVEAVEEAAQEEAVPEPELIKLPDLSPEEVKVVETSIFYSLKPVEPVPEPETFDDMMKRFMINVIETIFEMDIKEFE